MGVFKNLNKPFRGHLLTLLTAACIGIVFGCGGGGSGVVNSTGGGGTGTSTGNNGGGGGGTTPPAGNLPKDVIFYSVTSQDSNSALQTDVRYIKSDGTGDTSYVVLPAGFQGFSPVAVSSPVQYVFGAQATSGLYGIYENTTISLTGATEIVPPTYSAIISIQVSNDGTKIIYVAAGSGASPTSYLFSAPLSKDGTVTQIDQAFSANLNRTGDSIVYSSSASTATYEIFIRPFSGGTATALTSDAADNLYPQFDATGKNIAFSKRPTGSAVFNLYTMAISGTTVSSVKQITTSTTLNSSGPSYNTDGSKLSSIGFASDGTQSGVYTVSTTSPFTTALVKAVSTGLGEDTNWTNTDGNRSRGKGGVASFGLHRKKALPPATPKP